MVQVIVSKEKLDEIMGLTEPFDLCDEFGRVVVRATVVKDEQRMVARDIPFTLEEIDQARRSPRRTTEQVRQRLKSLESSQ